MNLNPPRLCALNSGVGALSTGTNLDHKHDVDAHFLNFAPSIFMAETLLTVTSEAWLPILQIAIVTFLSCDW